MLVWLETGVPFILDMKASCLELLSLKSSTSTHDEQEAIQIYKLAAPPLAKVVVKCKLAALEFDVRPSRWKQNKNSREILMQTFGV